MLTPSVKRCPTCGAAPGQLCNIAVPGSVEYIHLLPDRLKDYVDGLGKYSPPVNPAKMIAFHCNRLT